MSELQKFENSESWRAKLRNFLLKENQPQEKRSEPFTETNRYSFDVSEDLKKLIEERKQKKMADQQLPTAATANVFNCENKENAPSNYEQTHIKGEQFSLIADDTILLVKNEISDDSFEAMEMMCNKTASDPNSTLFQYLNSDQAIKKIIKQEQKEVVAESKKRLSDDEPMPPELVQQDPENAAIDRLLNDLRMEGQRDIADESPLKGVEMTQIEDIEAPSRFWENDTILQTSPVKMVGLLRPSTILECAEISDVSSAQTSFKSAATRYPLSEVSSSSYETASETMPYKQNSHEVNVELDLHASINLIDLEKTMQETHIKEKSIDFENPQMLLKKAEILIDLTMDAETQYESDESEESVIEVPSDEEYLEEQQSIALMKFEDVTLNSPNDQPSDDEHLEEHQSIALMKFEDDTLNSGNDQRVEKNALSTSTTSKEQSLHFNDTLEEVEYMMQKGLEYMAGAGITPKQSPFKPQTLPSPHILEQKLHTFIVSPAKAERKLPEKEELTPIATFGSPARSSKKSPLKKDSRFELKVGPFPKLELFKKPTSASKSATKPLSRQKDKFAHIVSPIGTYIKKAGEPCLLSGIKTGSDEKNSSAFRELDFESRAHKPNFGNRKAELHKSSRTLPKKAYISSEYRQVVDNRAAVTIPGSKNLQKYLDAAVLPSVIQHDGKANLPGNSAVASKFPVSANKQAVASTMMPKRAEIRKESFANLSAVTGDVSLYTIKDAQKL